MSELTITSLVKLQMEHYMGSHIPGKDVSELTSTSLVKLQMEHPICQSYTKSYPTIDSNMWIWHLQLQTGEHICQPTHIPLTPPSGMLGRHWFYRPILNPCLGESCRWSIICQSYTVSELTITSLVQLQMEHYMPVIYRVRVDYNIPGKAADGALYASHILQMEHPSYS